MKDWDDLDSELSSLLQDSAIEHDPGDRFDQTVVRTAKLNYHARTLRFWTPAILGGLVAALGLLAAIEMVYFAPSAQPLILKGHEAKAQRQQPLIPEVIEQSGDPASK